MSELEITCVDRIHIGGSAIEILVKNDWFGFLTVQRDVSCTTYYLYLRDTNVTTKEPFFPLTQEKLRSIKDSYSDLIHVVAVQLAMYKLENFPPYTLTTLHTHNIFENPTFQDDSLYRTILTRLIMDIIFSHPLTGVMFNYLEMYYEDIHSSSTFVSYIVSAVTRYHFVGIIAVWYGDGYIPSTTASFMFSNLTIYAPVHTPYKRLVSMKGFGFTYSDTEESSIKHFRSFVDRYDKLIPSLNMCAYVGPKNDSEVLRWLLSTSMERTPQPPQPIQEQPEVVDANAVYSSDEPLGIFPEDSLGDY